MNEIKYWWCNSCEENVDTLHAPNVGMFCIQCGTKVVKPENIPDPAFYDFEDEDIDL